MDVYLRKIVSVNLGFSLLFSLLSLASAATGNSVKDYESHWAQKQIESWLDKGWLKGFADGSVKPDQGITRAEFVTLINRSFDIRGSMPVRFTDVPTTGWIYEEFAKAASAGYIKGYGDKVRPNDPLTRQEAAVIISDLLKLEDASDLSALNKFKDRDQIAAWSASKVGAMINSGIMKGYPSGNFAPLQAITRAEVVTIIEPLTTKLGGAMEINEAGVFGGEDPTAPAFDEGVTVNTYGVTLKNFLVLGDLRINEGVGEGDVSLENVTVKGKVIVKGGGANSIHFKDSILGEVVVQKKGGKVSLVAEGTTQIKTVTVQSGAFIQLGQGTSVAKLILDAVTKVTGQGQILAATVNQGGKGSSFEKKPDLVEGVGLLSGTSHFN
ncbi:S-layer homology domain-containing protein [Paenibacillus odorifer]|uniref:SLH domain-containing protein n=1 Tax=Paenibacillus odorifer TaxID=189426 RepID=A0ABX3GK80_9BACL|nr:S-layer homology domain-containing protein [Paenibacillus odorifer]OMD18567.1 hypothetical protein BSO21_26430 [Paenibacillus odorifer]